MGVLNDPLKLLNFLGFQRPMRKTSLTLRLDSMNITTKTGVHVAPALEQKSGTKIKGGSEYSLNMLGRAVM